MTGASSPVVIVGSGQAGVQVADSLRQGGFGGSITLIGEEPDHPYQRPPLSKDFMIAASTQVAAALPLRPENYFAQNAIEFRAGTRAIALDRTLHVVELDDGGRLPYGRLVLATGAEPRELSVPGASLRGVHVFRTLDDARALRSQLDRARSVVVIGAGFIGLEFAAAARKRGLAVTVLEAAPVPLRRALSATLAGHLTEMHMQMGTTFRFGTTVTAFLGEGGDVTAVLDDQDTAHQADLVLIGIGVVPRVELARASGLTVADGIVVDERLLTNDPAIFAAGDCTVFPDGRGSRLRIESVQNATAQGRHVAAQILGAAQPYSAVPWFWSNQGHLRLQIAGLASPDDGSVVVGEPQTGRFSVFRFRGTDLVAVESLGRPADHAAARRLLAGGRRPSPEQAAADGFSLKDFLNPPELVHGST